MDFIGIELIDAITVGSFLLALITIIFIYSSTLARDPMRGRIKHLQARRDALKAGFIAPVKRRNALRTVASVSFMRQVVTRLKLLQSETTKKQITKLSQAGFRSKDAVIVYLFSKLIMPAIGVGIALIVVYGLNVQEDQPVFQALIAISIVLLTFFLPDLVVKNTADKRTNEIRKALPDALDLLVICAEAGLTLDAALTRVAKELAGASPELADEFSLTAIELGFLTERRQALFNLTQRVNLRAVKGVVATLIQTEKYGTPLAHSLRVLSAEFRNERMMRAEEKAARLPAIMTIPLILFILPTLFIVLLGPAACQVSDNFINRF